MSLGQVDEVLGSIGSGIDFEKRIGDIYQKCRTEEQIQFNFDQLQQEMEIQIDERITADSAEALGELR